MTGAVLDEQHFVRQRRYVFSEAVCMFNLMRVSSRLYCSHVIVQYCRFYMRLYGTYCMVWRGQLLHHGFIAAGEHVVQFETYFSNACFDDTCAATQSFLRLGPWNES